MIMLVIRQSLSVITEVLIKEDKKTCPIMCFSSHNKWPLTVKRTLEVKTFVPSPMKQLYSGSLVWNDVIQLLCPLLQQVSPQLQELSLEIWHTYWFWVRVNDRADPWCVWLGKEWGTWLPKGAAQHVAGSPQTPRSVLKDSTRVSSHEG